MKSCFENYIALEQLSPEVIPKSGLYINRLPGISVDMFSALADSDVVDGAEFWSNLYDRAVSNFVNSLSGMLSKQFEIEKVLESKPSGLFVKPFEANLTDQDDAGVSLDFIHTKYSTTEIKSIKYYSLTESSPSTSILLIIDAESEELLDFIEIDALPGLNKVDVNKSYDANKIRIVYDPFVITSYITADYKYDNHGTCNSSRITQHNGGGLVIEYITKCDIEKFICSRLSIFKNAFWYWLGVELMTERMLSENTNCFTIDREKAKDLLSFYENEYLKQITPIIENLNVKDDMACFNCKNVYSKKIILP